MMLRPQPRDHRRCELASRNKTDSEGAEAELLVHMKRERRRCEANDQTPARPSDLLNPFLKRLMEEVWNRVVSLSFLLPQVELAARRLSRSPGMAGRFAHFPGPVETPVIREVGAG